MRFKFRMTDMFKITKEKITFKKIIYITLGSISLALGFIGVFLPVLPTTPFLLLTAWFYAKSSQRLYFWILHNKYFGKYIKRYREGSGIPLKTKIISISFLWISMINTVVFFISMVSIKILLLLIAVAVSYHILSRPTYKGE